MSTVIKAEVRDLWADALESGEYLQTTGVLHRYGEGFCCLGVLCDLAVKAGVIPEPESHYRDGDPGDDVTGVYVYGVGSDFSHTGLPLAVVRWAGLHNDDPEDGGDPEYGMTDPYLYDESGVARAAATWNDSQRATFTDIAAMVRAIPAAE